jgi:hypothetical protein
MLLGFGGNELKVWVSPASRGLNYWAICDSNNRDVTSVDSRDRYKLLASFFHTAATRSKFHTIQREVIATAKSYAG